MVALKLSGWTRILNKLYFFLVEKINQLKSTVSLV
jgi:hypothetical protein